MKTLYIRLSDDAYAGYRDFCVGQGVTVTSWVEAIGLLLDAVDEDVLLEAGFSKDVLKAARVIDGRRRSRDRGDSPTVTLAGEEITISDPVDEKEEAT